MLINHYNQNETDNINIHDSIFAGYCYIYEKRCITMRCKNYFTGKCLCFYFCNVIISELQSCSFWNGGNRIMWVEAVDPTASIQRIKDESKIDSVLLSDSLLNKGIAYIAIRFTVNSGDTFLVVCESVDVIETDL